MIQAVKIFNDIGSASDGNSAHREEGTAYAPYLDPYRLDSLCIPVNGASYILLRLHVEGREAGGKLNSKSASRSQTSTLQPDHRDNATRIFKLLLFERLASEILSKASP
jgi:hypothetical protein